MTTIVCDLSASGAGATLVDALSTQGYAALVGHGVADDVIATMRAVSLEFFDLPREEKARCEWVGHDVWRGWQPVFEGGERFADDSTVEWREWLEENLCASAGGPDNPLNNWPPVPVALRLAWEAYHAAMFELAARVIGVLAGELAVDPGVLPAWQAGQYSNLVANHYPAQTVAPKPGQVRVNPHTDHGGITLLQVDDAPGGLEVAYDRVGWQAATVPTGALVVQAGDLLERLTAGRLRATPHRVVNPPLDAGEGGRRLSLVYFHHPDLDAVVAPSTEGPKPLPPIVARDWIEHRQVRYQRDGVSDLVDLD
ncbi:MAG TPA: 2OG-Fe(II) oxygenase family protein [Acidimicrobiia bacterium]